MKCPPNPNANKFVPPEGYTDIGWQVDINNVPRKKCYELGHTMRDGQHKEFDNSLVLYRCTDVITICSACKIYWHADMSD